METMEKHTKEQQEAYRRYEALVQQFERQVKELKARAKEAQDKAQAEAPMTDDLREAFLLLPDDTRELQMLVDTKVLALRNFDAIIILMHLIHRLYILVLGDHLLCLYALQ